MGSNELRYNQAAERNREPILNVLQQVLPACGRVLEIASGTGQHIVHFARALSALNWLPSDPDYHQRLSITAYLNETQLTNIEPPLDLDVLEVWPGITVDAVITANLLHISPPETLPALCTGAANVLKESGILHIYGPFNRDGKYTSEGNRRFDASLREQNADWGIRDMEQVLAAADARGFVNQQIIAMPANNFSLVFKRSGKRSGNYSGKRSDG